jgi:hypothetical protein
LEAVHAIAKTNTQDTLDFFCAAGRDVGGLGVVLANDFAGTRRGTRCQRTGGG